LIHLTRGFVEGGPNKYHKGGIAFTLAANCGRAVENNNRESTRKKEINLLTGEIMACNAAIKVSALTYQKDICGGKFFVVKKTG